ncbi:MAG: hypothetical protein QOJ37_2127, partial [Pseudonocardiales bacterium]|nr:hypothetical protein [Pseudonocardiales bacterium]
TGAAGSAPSPNSGTLQLSMQAFVAPVAQSAAASPTATPSK